MPRAPPSSQCHLPETTQRDRLHVSHPLLPLGLQLRLQRLVAQAVCLQLRLQRRLQLYCIIALDFQSRGDFFQLLRQRAYIQRFHTHAVWHCSNWSRIAYIQHPHSEHTGAVVFATQLTHTVPEAGERGVRQKLTETDSN